MNVEMIIKCVQRTLMLFSLLVCLQLTEDSYAECKAIVVTSPDGQPIPGVLVEARNAVTGQTTSVLTDQSGRAEVEVERDADTTIKVTKPGYETRVVPASQVRNEEEFRDLRPTGSVTGKVLSGRGEPVKSGVVFARGSQLGQSHVVGISDDGQFTFSQLPAGVTIALHASVEGQRSERVSLIVPEGSAKIVNLVMDEKRNIFGRITFSNGANGWRKVLVLDVESQLVSEQPLIDGVFDFLDLPPSIYKIGIRGENDVRIVGEVDVREESVYGLTLTVE